MRRFFYFLPSIVTLMSCESEPEHRRIADKIMKEHILYIREKFGAQLSMVCGGFNKKVNNITLGFDVRGPVDLERARILLITFSSDLLDRINSSKEIRPHLLNYPFLPVNLTYSIFFVNESGNHMKSPGNLKSKNSLARSKVLEGSVSYSIFNEDKPYLQTVHRETYEQALEIVNREGRPFLNDMWQ